MLGDVTGAIANILRTVPGLGIVYERPVPEVARKFPSVMIIPPQASYRPLTRDGLGVVTASAEVWIAMPIDQKTSDAAWSKLYAAVDAVVERLAPIETFGIAQNGGIENLGTQLVQRPPEAGGPFVEARLRVRLVMPYQAV